MPASHLAARSSSPASSSSRAASSATAVRIPAAPSPPGRRVRPGQQGQGLRAPAEQRLHGRPEHRQEHLRLREPELPRQPFRLRQARVRVVGPVLEPVQHGQRAVERDPDRRPAGPVGRQQGAAPLHRVRHRDGPAPERDADRPQGPGPLRLGPGRHRVLQGPRVVALRLLMAARLLELLGEAEVGPGPADRVPRRLEDRQHRAGRGGGAGARRRVQHRQREAGVRGLHRGVGQVPYVAQQFGALLDPAERHPYLAEPQQRPRRVRPQLHRPLQQPMRPVQVGAGGGLGPGPAQRGGGPVPQQPGPVVQQPQLGAVAVGTLQMAPDRAVARPQHARQLGRPRVALRLGPLGERGVGDLVDQPAAEPVRRRLPGPGRRGLHQAPQGQRGERLVDAAPVLGRLPGDDGLVPLAGGDGPGPVPGGDGPVPVPGGDGTGLLGRPYGQLQPHQLRRRELPADHGRQVHHPALGPGQRPDPGAQQGLEGGRQLSFRPRRGGGPVVDEELLQIERVALGAGQEPVVGRGGAAVQPGQTGGQPGRLLAGGGR